MQMRSDFSMQRKAMLRQGPLSDLRELVNRIEMYGEDTLIVERHDTQKVQHSAKELCDDVRALATALVDSGVCGCNIAILSENSYRWIVAFLAVSCGVGTVVPLDKELTESELDVLLQNGNAEALFCSSTFFDTVIRNLNKKAGLRCAFSMDSQSDDLPLWEELIAKGKLLRRQDDRRFEDLQVNPDDVAAVIFTSGTTGPNKGVMLTHKNFVSNINAIAENVSVGESTISILPMNHVYELNCNILPMLYIHSVICINDRMRNLMRNFRFFKPSMAVVVPLFLESFYEHIRQKLRKDGIDQKTERAIVLSNQLLECGIDIRRSLFKRIHEYFGGELRLLICGGAPANAKYIKGLTELGFDIYVGYGLTEAAPIAAINANTRLYPDRVGQAFYNTKIHIHAPDEDGNGEVWLRGENITPGYYNDPQATAESFENGWFKTGDIGKMTDDGQLILTGRKKNLIILDNGKNVHPEEIEDLLLDRIPYIREVVVFESEKEIFGAMQKIIAAVVYVDSADFKGKTTADIENMVKSDVMTVNADLPGYKALSRVMVSQNEFQKTATNKILRRKVIEEYTGNRANKGEDDA